MFLLGDGDVNGNGIVLSITVRGGTGISGPMVLCVFRRFAGGWTKTVGIGIGGAEGRGWITVVVVVARQQHLQKQ